MSKFKVGDKVKCVNNTRSEDNLTEGAVYTVRFVDTNYVAVDGIGCVLAESRFELSETEKTPLDIIKEMYEDAWRNNKPELTFYLGILDEAFNIQPSIKSETTYTFTYTPKN